MQRTLSVITASLDDDIRTLIYTGRPLRVRRTAYIEDWYAHPIPHTLRPILTFRFRENNRTAEMKELLAQGKLPVEKDMEKNPEKAMSARPWLLGKVSGLIDEVLPAKKIIDDMVSEAAARLNASNKLVVGGAQKAKL